MVAWTATRVTANTSPAVNAQVRRETEKNILYYALRTDQIDRRLAELDREWDIERCLETGAASLTLFGVGMSMLHSRKWLVLPTAVAGFFLQHALQGWCPPLPVFRRLGVRTADEINEERYALKALRGDFAHLSSQAKEEGKAGVACDPAKVIRAVQNR